jgi:hypothetical protein
MFSKKDDKPPTHQEPDIEDQGGFDDPRQKKRVRPVTGLDHLSPVRVPVDTDDRIILDFVKCNWFSKSTGLVGDNLVHVPDRLLSKGITPDEWATVLKELQVAQKRKTTVLSTISLAVGLVTLPVLWRKEKNYYEAIIKWV